MLWAAESAKCSLSAHPPTPIPYAPSGRGGACLMQKGQQRLQVRHVDGGCFAAWPGAGAETGRVYVSGHARCSRRHWGEPYGRR